MIFLLALLTLVSPEQLVHGPYTPAAQRLDRLVVAGDGRNVLVAFTAVAEDGVERVNVKRVGDAPLEMMLSTDNATRAGLPSLARIGDRYLLAWSEEFITPNTATPFTPRQRTLAIRLDANGGRVDYVPFNLHETDPIVDPGQNTFAIADRDAFRVFTTQGVTWESRISPDGGLLAPSDVVVAPIAAVSAASNGRTTAFATATLIPAILPFPPPPAYFGVYTSAGERFRAVVSSGTDAVNAVATNGSGFLAVWRESASVRGVILDDEANPVGEGFTIAAAATQTDVTRPLRVVAAWTGSQYLVAFDSMGDILGATVATDGSVTSTFPISASPADERLPAVHAIGDGRVLVAYQQFAGSDSRIAVRTVSVPPSRPRATRAR